jgi:hypothetical protein
MYLRRIVIIFMSMCGTGCLFLAAGCSDDSTKSGTQLQISPAVKAEINDMKAAQKELMAERKAAAGKKKKR